MDEFVRPMPYFGCFMKEANILITWRMQYESCRSNFRRIRVIPLNVNIFKTALMSDPNMVAMRRTCSVNAENTASCLQCRIVICIRMYLIPEENKETRNLEIRGRVLLILLYTKGHLMGLAYLLGYRKKTTENFSWETLSEHG